VELPCLDIGIERHVDGTVFAAEDPKLRWRPIFLQHRRTEDRLDVRFAEPDQPIDPLRADLRGIFLGFGRRISRRHSRLSHGKLRMRRWLGRDGIGRARLQRAAGAKLRRRSWIGAAHNEHRAERTDQMPLPTQLHARSAMNSTRAWAGQAHPGATNTRRSEGPLSYRRAADKGANWVPLGVGPSGSSCLGLSRANLAQMRQIGFFIRNFRHLRPATRARNLSSPQRELGAGQKNGSAGGPPRIICP